ncbi:MAG TPA: hypothetical protein VG986_04600 [Pseudolabrys sp.]|nr:hypothetical protein [Pseudolabrys sp.]
MAPRLGLRHIKVAVVPGPEMTPQSFQMLLALALGFAASGLCCSSYRLITDRLPSFGLLTAGPRATAFAAVPLLIVAAPFLIMRNTLLGNGSTPGQRFQFVFLATLVAGFWSLMSGLALVMTLEACGLLLA